MTRTYHQLTYEQRCQIYALMKRGDSQRAIAEMIGVSQSTVSRELKRNEGGCGYRFKQAQEKAEQRRREANEPSKMTPDLIVKIEEKLREDWSPEQVAGWLLHSEETLVSHETIYKHIWADKQAGGDLYKHLRRQGKKYNKRSNGKSTRGQIVGRVSIDDRPAVVDEKERIGDWEIDTIIGKNHSGALVTIVERVTNFSLAAQVNGKRAEDVTKATIELLKPYQSLVHTITADNGKEFAYHSQISEALDAEFYFAHPYSSWERGLNENTNGLLRQYFPKGTDLKEVSQTQVDCAIAKLNARPRKGLDFKTPNALINAHYAAAA